MSKIISIPAFVDMHCHTREPGYEYKEDIESCLKAAYAGGYAAVVAMPNTNPVTDNADTLSYVVARANEVGLTKLLPTAAITVGQKGESLTDFAALYAAGAVAFTDDGRPVERSDMMASAMKICADHDYLIISHCEELPLAGGAINDGDTAKKLGVRGTPNAAEDVMTARDIILSEMTGCRLHIAHVSTKGSVELIRAAKKRGVRVTAETCPHYFTFIDEDVERIGVNAKMNPPLRSKEDRDAIIEAIVDCTIDCISTDHAPHSAEEKGRGLASAPNGIIGLQTSFAAAYTYLVKAGHITLERLSELLTYNPCKILGIAVPEEIIDIEIEEPFVFDESIILSKSHNSPYIGMTLYGKVIR